MNLTAQKVGMIMRSVEDLTLFTTALREQGHQTIYAFTDPVEATTVLSREQCGLLVVRLELANTAGPVVIEKLRSTGNYGLETVLFVADQIELGVLHSIQELDLTYVLVKPFNLERISQKYRYMAAREAALTPAEVMYRQAKAALLSGNIDPASSLAQELLTSYPKIDKTYLLLGDIERRYVRLLQARSYYTNAQSIAPLSALAAQKIASTLLEEGKFAEAYAILERIWELAPYSIRLLEEAGIAQIRVKEYDKARISSSRIKEIDPENKTAKLLLVDANIGQERITGVGADLAAATENDRDFIAKINARGLELIQENKLPIVISFYQECIPFIRENKYAFAAYFNLALAYKKVGNLEKSKEFLVKTIEANPSFLRAQQLLTSIMTA